MAATSSTGGRGASRDPPSAPTGRRGNNYTSLNLQSYKGARPDGKGFSGSNKGGMQSLGKVVATSRRMPNPASLPSLRSENAGNDPSVALVPSGGGGWKKDKDGKEVKEGGDTPSPPPRPDRPRDNVQKKEPARIAHAPPPPPVRQQQPPPNPTPIPGKQFKADFPSLEEQETMSRKEVEELHRRRGREGAGSPEHSTGKRTSSKGAWEHEQPHGASSHGSSRGPVPPNVGHYPPRYNYPPVRPGSYPPPPYMMHPHHSGPGMPPFHGGPQMHNPPGPGRGHFPPPHVGYHAPFSYPADPYKMPEGYHDELARPPTVKMDDIKSMDVEEEEGGWAGHHEEVDYSKEVVFSDSSDEDNSGRQSNVSGKASEQPSATRSHQRRVKGSRSRQSVPDERMGGEHPNSPIGKPEPREGHRQGREQERRGENASGPKRHEAAYHPYQRPSQYPPSAVQYPPNYPPQAPYPTYPPPYGTTGGHRYPPQQQHMGGGGMNRYPPHRSGGPPAHARSFPEHTWGGGEVSKKKWESKEKPTILAKGEKKASQDEKTSGDGAKERSEAPQKPPDSPVPLEAAGERSKVTFAGVEDEEEGESEVVEEQVQPTRRGNQPKIMLRKLGDKEVDGRGDERSGEGRKLRSEMKGDSDEGRAEAASKTKMAWTMQDRGPIITPKTLYEPEGKKSADKFKKYHSAQMQELQRKAEQGAGDESDTAKSPLEKKEGMTKQLKPDSDPPKQHHEPTKVDGAKVAGRDSPDLATKQSVEFSRQHSRDKPQHRKDDARRGKGSQDRRQEPGPTPKPRGEGEHTDGRFEQRPRNSSDRKQDMHRNEGGRQDAERWHNSTEGRGAGNRRQSVPDSRDGDRRREGPEVKGENRGHERPGDDKRHEGQDVRGGDRKHVSDARGGDRRHSGPEAKSGHNVHEGRSGDRWHEGLEAKGGERRHGGSEARGDKRHSGQEARDRRHDGPENRGRHDGPAARDRRHDGPEARDRRHDGPEMKAGGERRHDGPDARTSGDRKHGGPPDLERRGHKNSQDQLRSGNRQSERRSDPKGRRNLPREQEGGDTRKGDKRVHREAGGHDASIVSERGIAKKGSEQAPDGRLEDQENRNRGQRGQAKKASFRREDKKERDRGPPPQRTDRAAKMPPRNKSNQEAQGSEGQKPRGQPALGYTEVFDIESDPDFEDPPPQGIAEQQEKEMRDDNKVQSAAGALEENATRGGSRPHHAAGSHGNNRKPVHRKEEKRKGVRRSEDNEDSSRRAGVGRGRGRDKGDVRWPGGQEKSAREEQKRGDKQQPKGEEPGDLEAVVGVETSSSQQKLDVTKLYDLNSHMVAVVDDMAGQTPDEGLLSPTLQAEFVEVTSKKAQKEKLRKEKEEQRREEKRLEEQRKKKKLTSNKNQSGSTEKAVNKPSSAWSTSDSGEGWNAAPGSQLKTVPGAPPGAATAVQWAATTMPAATFGLGKGDPTPGQPIKPAVPHTAELVTTGNPDMYSLFGRPVSYLPFSPSAPTMLDAAVDSTIGTVTSPRTVTGHTPLIMDPPLPLETPLVDAVLSAEVPALPTEGKADTIPSHAGANRHPGSKSLPPRLKGGGVGRGRGAAQKGVGDRRDRRRGKPDRDHVGRQDKQGGPSEEVPYPLSGVPSGRKGEHKRLYVHPRARNTDGPASSKDSKCDLSGTSKPSSREEAKNEEQTPKVAAALGLPHEKQLNEAAYEVAMAAQQRPRAGRVSAASEEQGFAQGSNASSQTEGSKVSTSSRPDSSEVRSRPLVCATVVSKTFSYAQALKTSYPRADSASSSKLSSPCPTPAESPRQSRVTLHSGRTTPSSGSTAGGAVSTPSPVSSRKLGSPVCGEPQVLGGGESVEELVGDGASPVEPSNIHSQPTSPALPSQSNAPPPFSDPNRATPSQSTPGSAPPPPSEYLKGNAPPSPLQSHAMPQAHQHAPPLLPQPMQGPAQQAKRGPAPQTNKGTASHANRGTVPQTNRGRAPQTNRGRAPQTNRGPAPQTNRGAVSKSVPLPLDTAEETLGPVQAGQSPDTVSANSPAGEQGTPLPGAVSTPPPDRVPTPTSKVPANVPSDPGLKEGVAKVSPPQMLPPLMPFDPPSHGVPMRIPPGISVPPPPLHIPNLTDHQKLLTQQQLLVAAAAAAQQQYGVPPRLPMPLPQPILSSLPPALLDQQQQQRGLLEQSRVLRAQDMMYHPHHLPHHPPVSTPLQPTPGMPQFPGKQSVLPNPPPQHLAAAAPRALLGNQPPMSHQNLELQKLLLHLLQQQHQQQQAQAQAQAQVQAQAQAQALQQKHSYLLQQQQALHMTKIQMEKMEAQSAGLMEERKASSSAPQQYQQPLLSQPVGGANKEVPTPYTVPNAPIGRPPAMFSPMVRLSSYLQPSQQGVAPRPSTDVSPPAPSPSVAGEASMETNKPSEADDSLKESLKSSSLSITATPFIPSNTADVAGKENSGKTNTSSGQTATPLSVPLPHPTATIGPPVPSQAPLPLPSQAPQAPPHLPSQAPPPLPSQAPPLPSQVPYSRGWLSTGRLHPTLPTRPVLPQKQQVRDGQAYQVISPQLDGPHQHSAAATAVLLHRQLSGDRRGGGKEGGPRPKDYRFPGHHGPDPALFTAMTTGLDMQPRHLPTQKPFPGMYGAGVGGMGRSKLPNAADADPGRAAHEALKQSAASIGNKRPLLPTPSPTHANILPPGLPPTWTAPPGTLPSPHGQQATLYPEQRNIGGYSGPPLIGSMAAYHRNQL